MGDSPTSRWASLPLGWVFFFFFGRKIWAENYLERGVRYFSLVRKN